MLGRVVDPLAARGRRPVAPHHDEIYRRLAPFLLPAKGTQPVQEGRPPQARAARARRNVALRRQPGTAGSRGQGVTGRCPIEGASRIPCQPATHSGAWAGSGAGSALRSGQHGRPRTTAERWIKALLERKFAPGRETTDAIFALSQLARVASDRARDLDEDLRAEVLARLTELGADEAVMRPVREYHELESAQQVQALGDSLPIGLRLLSDATT